MNTTSKTGRAIGLFPGSFNPAHEGHLHVAKAGLTRLKLDEIWWIPSPQNPLKSKQPPYQSRADSVSALFQKHNTGGMRLSHIERDRGTNKTIDLLRGFERRRDLNRYVLMIGADNFGQLPRWVDWQGIMERIPIAVIARPSKSGELSLRPRLGPAARIYANQRLSESDADLLQWKGAPCWTYLTLPINSLSSTQIRAKRK